MRDEPRFCIDSVPPALSPNLARNMGRIASEQPANRMQSGATGAIDAARRSLACFDPSMTMGRALPAKAPAGAVRIGAPLNGPRHKGGPNTHIPER